MRKISNVRVLPGYQMEIEFDDGVSGTVDLSENVGKSVFALWRDPLAFERVRIGSSGELVWDDRIDLRPDALEQIIASALRDIVAMGIPFGRGSVGSSE